MHAPARQLHNGPMKPVLSSIRIYPLKSAAALKPEHALVEARGLAGDRRWMVVDAVGKFVTARKHPRLLLIRADAGGDGLVLDAPGMPRLHLEPAPASPRLEVSVWRNQMRAMLADEVANAWISRYLGFAARFVHMDAEAIRPVDPDYSQAGDEVSFADGYPLLLISRAALDALNEKLELPVTMSRFRPNLVVADTLPHAEDGWRSIRIGQVRFDVVKPCSRCVLTTVDPHRGEFDPAGEPLRTLTGYRRSPGGVTFGQNLIPRGNGRIALGDEVEILG